MFKENRLGSLTPKPQILEKESSSSTTPKVYCCQLASATEPPKPCFRILCRTFLKNARTGKCQRSAQEMVRSSCTSMQVNQKGIFYMELWHLLQMSFHDPEIWCTAQIWWIGPKQNLEIMQVECYGKLLSLMKCTVGCKMTELWKQLA